MPKVLEKRKNIRGLLKQLEEMGVDSQILSECLAVHPKTVRRWQDGEADPGDGTNRFLEKLESVCGAAIRLLKRKSRKTWFLNPNGTLGGERPVDILRRGEIDRVGNVLGMLEWGIYS